MDLRIDEISTVDSLAKELKLKPGTIRDMIRDGRLDALKTAPGRGGRILILRSAVAAMLAALPKAVAHGQ